MCRSKCWKFIITLFTVQCKIHVRTSEIQGEGGCEYWSISKRTLLDLQVNSLLITQTSRLAEINTDLSFKRTLKYIKLRAETFVSARDGQQLVALWEYCVTSHEYMGRFWLCREGQRLWLRNARVVNYLSVPILWPSGMRMCLFWHRLQRANLALLYDCLMLMILMRIIKE